MNKRELAPIVAEATGLSPEQAMDAIDAMLDTIMHAVAGREPVDIRGFGGFRLRERHSEGINPRTGEVAEAVHGFAPYFKCGRKLQARVTGS